MVARAHDDLAMKGRLLQALNMTDLPSGAADGLYNNVRLRLDVESLVIEQ